MLNGYIVSGQTDELLSFTDFIEITGALLRTGNKKTTEFYLRYLVMPFPLPDFCLVEVNGVGGITHNNGPNAF